MSKRIWHHPEESAGERTTRAWRSVGELEETPQFRAWMEREFPEGSGHLSEEDREVSRRSFVKLMGASSALAGFGLASCHRPEAYIVPYKTAPEWIVPGKPLFYATARPCASGAVPVVATCFDGRPTKLEPNREHPEGAGTDAFTQASVLNLYDPNRSREFLHNGAESTREAFAAALAGLAQAPGKIGFVFGEDDCPTRHRLAGELAGEYAGAKLYRYEALAGEGRKEAYAGAFGTDAADVMADYEKADVILSLDCDFVSLDLQGDPYPFFKRRQGGGEHYTQEIDPAKMNRLYSVETAFSLTGGMADHRLRAAPSEIFRAAVEIARAVQAEANDPKLAQVLAKAPPRPFAEGWKQDWIKECAADLVKHKGKAAVLAGSRHHAGLHEVVVALNAALDAYGAGKPLRPVRTGREGYGTLAGLTADLNSGAIDTVIFLGPGNPVYDAPADLEFGKALAKAKTSIHLGLRTDATARKCTWHVPGAHFLESWSDARTAAGSYVVVQPMILPLYGGISEVEMLAHLLALKDVDWAAVERGEAEAPVLIGGEAAGGGPSPALAEVRKTFATVGAAGDAAWKEALKNGFAAGSGYEVINVSPSFSPQGVEKAAAVVSAPSENALEVSFAADASVWDGRYIDNSWLQEAPDPVTKVTWDNAAFVSPKTAEALGVYDAIAELETARALKPEVGEGQYTRNPLVTVVVNGRELTLPMAVAFGHAENCITISLGYGQGATDGRPGAPSVDAARPVVGLVGRNAGFNAYPLRKTDSLLFATGATVSKAGGDYPLAFTQEHHAMYGRALAREISTDEKHVHKSFEEQLEGVKTQGIDSHMPPNISLYKPKGSALFEDDEAKVDDLISDKIHQWGMAIDLNTCMGCNACLVACQAENNIPAVGKDQVIRGREMHWIRMDRYYAVGASKHHGGEEKHADPYEHEAAENPEMIPQPVACVQCESAPCETVCPVNATVHTEEGLNTMAYIRCIGTRYCANNCPYKARRFNYFDYNKRNPLIEKNLYKGPFGKTQVGTAKHLQHNPNVTVRMRGVMEKCTYCVQRLEAAKINRKQVQRAKTLESGTASYDVKITEEDLRVGTDRVRTACQDACPAGAITFGNLLDKGSELVRAKGSHFLEGEEGSARNYDLLNYVGTRPRTSYLARVKNPNPKMPDAAFRGQATVGMT
ncbi:MAG: TAT-variant-translocated molybdopterin oxidoreductase [Akkermansiaceae bacterium]|nr:TAT-variant-translocated molybdopterin oxidoreductase [Akkermansiaceae bacterium]